MMRPLVEKYRHLPIVVAGDSMADIIGWTDTVGKLQYIGDKKFQNEDLVCLTGSNYEGKSRFSGPGLLKYMNASETLCSLVEFSTSHWGLSAICYALRYVHSDVDLFLELRKRNLLNQLEEKLLRSIELDEDDDSILVIYDLWLNNREVVSV